MPTEARSETTVVFQGDGIAAGALTPVALRVDEGISTLRRIELELVFGTESIDARSLLRKPVQIDVRAGGATVRRFEGVVMAATERFRGDGAVLTLTIGSPLDFLALSTDCRIFQEKKAPDIAKAVFTACGVPAASVVDRLSQTYEAHASCTQYGETMLAFVTRVLGAEGAYYFLDDAEGGLRFVLGDAASSHEPMEPSTLPYVIDRGMLTGSAVVQLTETSGLRPGKVTLGDLDWQKPKLDISGTAKASAFSAREHYEYPGHQKSPSHAKLLAKIKLEAFAGQRAGIAGMAHAPGMAPGKTFTLEHGPRPNLDTEWLVTQVTHLWSAGDEKMRSQFRALKKSMPYRPQDLPPVPRIRGTQTAFVTGPSGQEIHTDEFCRVKLKFHWDRHGKFDDKSSAWVRVAQLSMTGAVLVPRVGWEVLVEFEHGHPDRPIVVGRLFNATYVPPYPQPGKKTVSAFMNVTSPGGEGHNELRLEDAAGSEHIHWHAQKDLLLAVGNDRRTTIENSRMVTIKADEEETVKGSRTATIKGMSDTAVSGDQSLTVKGQHTETITKDDKFTVVGNRKVSVTKNHTVTSDEGATIAAGGDVKVSVGGALSEKADEGVSVAVGTDMATTIGGAADETAAKGKSHTVNGKRNVTIGGAAINNSGKDLSLLINGKASRTVGAAWSVTATKDAVLSSGDALELTIGAALTMTGAAGLTIVVGSSKVTLGPTGVTIQADKVKITSDGPASLLAGLVGSK
jgi:type VI secretion system secreted protein VgrG